jgi:hypothetical protein
VFFRKSNDEVGALGHLTLTTCFDITELHISTERCRTLILQKAEKGIRRFMQSIRTIITQLADKIFSNTEESHKPCTNLQKEQQDVV